jgi:hypothetical protein
MNCGWRRTLNGLQLTIVKPCVGRQNKQRAEILNKVFPACATAIQQPDKIMNTNQKFPGNGSPVPVLVIIGLGFALVNWLLSDDTENKPETAPANTETENRRKEAETPVFRQIPAEIPAKPAIIPIHSAPAPVFPPAVAPVPAIIPSFSVPPVPKVSAPVPAPQKIAAQIPPPPIKKKFVTHEDLATVFDRGARGLTRPAAVAALKRLGFGKSAAYDALAVGGRFADWLQFAPDGTITWTD